MYIILFTVQLNIGKINYNQKSKIVFTETSQSVEQEIPLLACAVNNNRAILFQCYLVSYYLCHDCGCHAAQLFRSIGCFNYCIFLLQVDAHNIVPCWIASDKLEYGARTIRGKITRNLSEYLTPFPPVIKHPFSGASKAKEVRFK